MYLGNQTHKKRYGRDEILDNNTGTAVKSNPAYTLFFEAFNDILKSSQCMI